jgi:hypothetical protein
MLRALKFYFIYLYTPNSNPILDTGVYEVTFPDCHVDEYAANIIIENMYQQVDSDGNTHLIFHCALARPKLPRDGIFKSYGKMALPLGNLSET